LYRNIAISYSNIDIRIAGKNTVVHRCIGVSLQQYAKRCIDISLRTLSVLEAKREESCELRRTAEMAQW